MSKISYLCIAIMVTALLFMGAVRGYRFYAQKAAQWEEERQHQTDAAFSFQQVPVSLAAPQAEPVSRPEVLPADATSMSILPESQKAPATPQAVPSATPGQGVFLEDAPLSPEQAVQQAQDTLRSIVRDYKNEPEIKSFNQELSQVTQGQLLDLSSLGQGDLRQVLRDNPQIQAVVNKHMQDPAFAQKVQQILSNPQFVESVRQLQQHQAATQTGQK